MSAPLTVYTYKSCDACRQATKWLAAKGLPFVEKPIRETPPSPAELRAMLAHLGGERRRLCNTSGKDYRDQKFGEVVDALSEADFFARLAANGNLIKRPFLLRAAAPARGEAAVGLTGFAAEVWAATLGV
ncbi:MAG: arsenate reductase family protein [Opitutaceae bacterium]|jgi:arsenate reductase|nr:arsenate reductase family protein [Opitutaceae bacterium]